jgi:flagellar protein FliS
MQSSNAYNTYKNNSVNYASKEQLLLMLLEGSVRFSKLARQAIQDKNIMLAHENIIKTENIYYELIIALDTKKNGDWANDLRRVYDFIVRRLVEANIKKDLSIMDEVIPLIEEIKDIWNEAYEITKGKKKILV